ncbi:uncharacterized protein LOC115228840 [Octopus sinensis]|uniref:Uncharacterized protein LOC115228840 n=1 Tax=Octopus sinensis TaxID=2607531 RepID=A0A6P7U2M4_9MOLL|nr:uncharacterized protein LOC115228840 [Octopus sinensis]
MARSIDYCQNHKKFFLCKSCLDLSLESEIDPCSVEEVNQEDYNIGRFSKKELLKINEHRNSRVERKDQIQHSEQSQIVENEQSYLLKVQMTMFVQLVVQLFMVSTNTPDYNTDIMASECRYILAYTVISLFIFEHKLKTTHPSNFSSHGISKLSNFKELKHYRFSVISQKYSGVDFDILSHTSDHFGTLDGASFIGASPN